MEHVTVFGSASGSVRSTSPNVQTTLAQPMLAVQQQPPAQATAFVQPTQQTPQLESTTQEPMPSTQVERPSTSTAVFGTGAHFAEESKNDAYGFVSTNRLSPH